MVTKKDLLKNVRNYSPQEIADAVRTGVVSLYELSKETEGAFTPLLKRQVKCILESPATFSDSSVKESMPTSIGVTSDSQAEPSIPVAIPIIPTSDPSVPIASKNVPVEEHVGTDANVEQPKDGNSTSNKPTMFNRAFSFNGRIRRLEYCLTYLGYCAWNMPMRVLSEEHISETYAIFYLVTLLPFLWLLFAQGAKRCHDRGNSGWYQIIPFYGLWMLFAEGETETNKYGICPK